MRIKSIEYSAVFNLGNYNNEKISFTADIEEGEIAEEVIKTLRDKAIECALPNSDDIRDYIFRSQGELRNLEQKLHKARKEWDATAQFLRTQGIKVDATDMPQFDNLLPGIAEEKANVVKGEIEEGNIF